MIEPHETEALALLAECYRHPTDATQRNILADWFEDRGRMVEADAVRNARVMDRNDLHFWSNFRPGPKGDRATAKYPRWRRSRRKAERDLVRDLLKALGCRTCRGCRGGGVTPYNATNICASCKGLGIKSTANDAAQRRARREIATGPSVLPGPVIERP
jgi:uncharacterized protein (TIGR02996 family)